MKRFILDLCCGLCGWSIPFAKMGYQVVAFDIRQYVFRSDITFVKSDVRLLSGYDYRGASVVLASPPCDEYARWGMPWTRARKPPAPDTSIWTACERIAKESSAPLILENVKAAQQFHGPARCHFGPFYLWGDGIPALLPDFRFCEFKKKESYGSSEKKERAVIPKPLAEWIASIYE